MKKKVFKIIAVLAALLIVARVVLLGVSAAMVGAGTAAVILAILAAALVSSGQYNQSQVNSMSNNEIISFYRSGVESGTIDPKQRIELPEGVTYDGSKFATVVDCFVDYNKLVFDGYAGLVNNWKDDWKDGINVIDNAVNDWFQNIVDFVTVGDVDNYIIPSASEQFWPYPSLGYGALAIQKYESTDKYGFVAFLYYCDYIVLYNDNYQCIMNDGSSIPVYRANEKGDIYYYFSGAGSSSAITDLTSFYGDVRYEDGTQVNEQETEYIIGETEDGTKVTVDMLNPDGTVTVDGVTYEPADFIDLDKFTDPAIIDLLNQILNALDNANVVAPDTTQDLVDSITDSIGDLTVSDELSDYVVPTGIITVFPFCLPFDFVRGMQLFSAKPETPHFEVVIEIPAFLNIPDQEWKFEIDLGQFETLAKITRWLSVFGFVYLLISLSVTIVKGAGA